MKMTNKRGLVAAAVLIAMVFFIIDKGILSRERFVQLSITEYEISSSKDWKNGIPKTKVNITAQLSLEDKTSAAVHEPPTLPVASNIPHVHPNLHPDNLTLINITNFKININYDICNVSQIGLVTIIHSAVPNKQARSAIRRIIKFQIKIETYPKMKVKTKLIHEYRECCGK
ncbi:uncharacterized protein LOC111706174 isoform X1 [Eurytemora carolleeae]|uniref:uncharacterized protein LOC111706174 isoform X1 n=1 Tax=Eurytemora carolleeae TaxID=1294199 RepID=UPI000C770CA3|nr:uncharacterized protein LOC111706174 isoform X1 [Eurytemora carolleeae]|eukprot:XP_023334734.1 uncharacterized protein LOC111706174 isoform X1 [Eurytemora affinis]